MSDEKTPDEVLWLQGLERFLSLAGLEMPKGAEPHVYDWAGGLCSDPRYKDGLPTGRDALCGHRIVLNGRPFDPRSVLVRRILTGDQGEIECAATDLQGRVISDPWWGHVVTFTLKGAVSYSFEPPPKG